MFKIFRRKGNVETEVRKEDKIIDMIRKGIVAPEEVGKSLSYQGGYVPYPVDSLIAMSGFNFRAPIQVVPWKNLYDIAYYSDVLRTVIKVITDEVFRNGIYLEERFKSKCTRCEAEFEDVKYVCPFCGGVVRRPDEREREKAKKWLEKYVNGFEEKLIDVLKQVDTDINICDNGFVVLIKDYVYSKNGDLVGFRVKEVVRGSPLKMRLVWSKYGLGRDEQGNFLYVCPMHRDKIVKKKKEGKYYCEQCGRELLPAYYAQFTVGGKNPIYYARGEVYHIKRWSNMQGYGFPPVLSVLLKTLTLLKMDRHMYLQYSLMRSPKGLLVIRGKDTEIRRAWEWLMQKARENPNMIYPLTISGGDGAKKLVEWIDFNLRPAEMEWESVREEFRRNIGMVYGVMPLFQGDLSQGAGLNNEGLQITVTNRTVEESQRVWNEFLKWFSRQIGLNDWDIRLRPHEEKDMKAELDRIEQRVRIMEMLRQMGFDVELVEGVDGLDFRVKEGKPKPKQEESGMMAGMLGGAGGEMNVAQQEEGAEMNMGRVDDDIEKAIRRAIEKLGVDGFVKKLGSIVDEYSGSPYRPRKRRKENMDIPDDSDVVSENTNKQFGDMQIGMQNFYGDGAESKNDLVVRREKKKVKKEGMSVSGSGEAVVNEVYGKRKKEKEGGNEE